MEVIEIEYETIVEQADDFVTFRIEGSEYKIPREDIMDYDLEGRVYLERSLVDRLGMGAA